MGALLKLLLTVLVILVAWWLVKFRGRISVLKAAVAAARKAAAGEAARTGAPATKGGVPVELVSCPKCGTYNAVGTPCACGG